MNVSMLAAAATAIVLAASMATGGCSSSSSGTGDGGQATHCTSADAAACPTGMGVFQLCTTSEGTHCIGAYTKVGSQTFMCNSCEDTTTCTDKAAAYCYGGDAGSSSSSGGAGDAAPE